ncbi:M24 family metallopeptidase [Noviherbaspirillum pedocola]|uniref:Aminopeptidase P family protein n=1 Tax=Noviherbaspirillum pedocola TaxID=2801341 RepID=A0A934W9X3_9BURK|nr:Xaa-Pro peptidase family protein [Noviherbaspirillum pedocola]MBK4737754.1 aminopeptidase P family protein [Noviherbaspirillum pedocola]
MDKRAGHRQRAAKAHEERRARVQEALATQGLSALLCAHGANVLMLSGYASVIGAAVAIATADGKLVLVVPEDELKMARDSWADDIFFFQAATLNAMHTGRAALRSALAKALDACLPEARHGGARIGMEFARAHLPASYASQLVYGAMLDQLIEEIAPACMPVPADTLLAQLRMRPTAAELERIRASCAIAAAAFHEGAARLVAGASEREAAQHFSEAYVRAVDRHADVTRADAFFYCMSGPNAAHAHAAFQQSTARRLLRGETILIHCNSHADGYWTDLSRTYVLGQPDARLARMQEAIMAARRAALAAIRPGVAAGAIDRAARAVLDEAGFGADFKHPTGHGVGFIAIDHEEPPQLHPHSHEPLLPGMVFNVEPGIYIGGLGGMRDCNMVAVTEDGHELLSPFQLEHHAWSIE